MGRNHICGLLPQPSNNGDCLGPCFGSVWKETGHSLRNALYHEHESTVWVLSFSNMGDRCSILSWGEQWERGDHENHCGRDGTSEGIAAAGILYYAIGLDNWKHIWPWFRRRSSKPCCQIPEGFWLDRILSSIPLCTAEHRSEYVLSRWAVGWHPLSQGNTGD